MNALSVSTAASTTPYVMIAVLMASMFPEGTRYHASNTVVVPP